MQRNSENIINTMRVKPVQQRLLIPLIATVLLVVTGFGLLMTIQQKDRLDEISLTSIKYASNDLSRALNDQSRALATIAEPLIREPLLLEALKNQNREELMKIYAPLFTALNKNYSITHFYFQGPDRTNLLRIHKPEKYGDTINRFTTLEAERTGKTTSGIEIGPLGTFTLRVVQPIFDGKVLIGYLEIGKEIEDILDAIHKNTGCQITVSLRKNELNRGSWKIGMKMLGRETNWDRLEEEVIIYSTLEHFPVEAEPFIGDNDHTHRNPNVEIQFSNSYWRILAEPLYDASGKEVGDLIVMKDISELKLSFQKRLLFGVLSCVAALIILGIFFFILLRRTDNGIRAQHSALQKSEKKHRSIIQTAMNGFWLMDTQGQILEVNNAYCKMSGYNKEELLTMSVADLEVAEPSEEFISKIEEIIKKGGDRFECRHRRKDGSIMDIGFSIKYQPDEGRLVCFLRDITDKKDAEMEKDKLIDELQQALNEIRTLRGILPICSHCKNIRDDKGYWQKVESYIEHHSEAEFSHSICPDCAKIYYPDLDLYED